MLASTRTSQISELLELVHHGDATARSRLIDYASDRLRRLAHLMMRSNRIRRWEQSDDLLQQTLLRLNRSLQRTEASTVKAFLELAALEMRHALVDLARRYFGPEGLGTHHDSHLDGTHDKVASVFVSAATGWLARQDSWRRLYEAVEALPDEEREVVDLIWIHELTHAEVAALLNVATKTIARRWARARLKLHEALGDEMIGI